MSQDEATPRIFVSHSSRDTAAVARLCAALSSAGIAWWAAFRDVTGSYQQEIPSAIRASRAVLVVLSAHALASDEIAKELDLANRAKLPRVPLRIEPVELAGSALEYDCSKSQWIDLFPSWERGVDLLLQRLPGLLTVQDEPPHVADARRARVVTESILRGRSLHRLDYGAAVRLADTLTAARRDAAPPAAVHAALLLALRSGYFVRNGAAWRGPPVAELLADATRIGPDEFARTAATLGTKPADLARAICFGPDS